MNNIKQEEVCDTVCCRQQAKGIIADKIRRLRHRADQLQILHDMLPERPTPEQDQALWSIICDLPQ